MNKQPANINEMNRNEDGSYSYHSALPWKQNFERSADIISGMGGRDFSVCLVNGPKDHVHYLLNRECQANAEFIVRACNAHYDLVAALRTALMHIANTAPNPSVVDKIEQALEKVK